MQQLSPFELDVTGPLFRNIGEKIRHKVEVSRASPCAFCVCASRRFPAAFWAVARARLFLACSPSLSPGASPPIARFRCVACTQDNVWDIAPPLLFFVGLISFTLWKREEILHHHRD